MLISKRTVGKHILVEEGANQVVHRKETLDEADVLVVLRDEQENGISGA